MPNVDTYELLVQNIVDFAIYMLDREGRVASWNAGAERIKGYTADEIIGQHFSRFYTDEDRAADMPRKVLRIAAETGRFATEAWRVRKDGSRFWAAVVVDPIYQGGELVGFAKITRDMTEQRNAQHAALESERRFRLLVQSVTDYAIFMLDTQGYITNWNAGAERIEGYAASEIIGQHFSTFYLPEDVEARLPSLALEVARSEGHYQAEGWRLRHDGSRFWASVVIAAIYDQGQHVGFAKITRDLTERREAQLQIEQSREQLLQAQKMEAIGQLTGGIAHDFNNLLTGITGSLELMRARVAQGRIGDLDRYITTAQGAAARAAALTHRLLAFARRQALDPKPVDANALIADMVELVRRTVGPGIELVVASSDELWLTLCDPNQLENALLNLCINARDAMPEGGRLTIRTENAVLDETGARPRELSAGEYVVIAVEDTGTGMTQEVAGRAFDPFFTTKPAGHGTGLGLSMIYGFARQSGGDARIASTQGKGTTVLIFLPRHNGSKREQAVPTLAPPVLRAKPGETVLVVDDEPTIRLLVGEVLGELGYAVIEAADGVSGLRVLQSDARIDLLISDVGLPSGVSGQQMAETGRQTRPALRVLFITGYAEAAAIGDTLDGGTQVLTKPFTMEALMGRLQTILAQAAPRPSL